MHLQDSTNLPTPFHSTDIISSGQDLECFISQFKQDLLRHSTIKISADSLLLNKICRQFCQKSQIFDTVLLENCINCKIIPFLCLYSTVNAGVYHFLKVTHFSSHINALTSLAGDFVLRNSRGKTTKSAANSRTKASHVALLATLNRKALLFSAKMHYPFGSLHNRRIFIGLTNATATKRNCRCLVSIAAVKIKTINQSELFSDSIHSNCPRNFIQVPLTWLNTIIESIFSTPVVNLQNQTTFRTFARPANPDCSGPVLFQYIPFWSLQNMPFSGPFVLLILNPVPRISECCTGIVTTNRLNQSRNPLNLTNKGVMRTILVHFDRVYSVNTQIERLSAHHFGARTEKLNKNFPQSWIHKQPISIEPHCFANLRLTVLTSSRMSACKSSQSKRSPHHLFKIKRTSKSGDLLDLAE